MKEETSQTIAHQLARIANALERIHEDYHAVHAQALTEHRID